MRAHLLPLCGTAVVAAGVFLASWPGAQAAPTSPVMTAGHLAPTGPELGAVSGSFRGEVIGVDLPRGRAFLSANGEARALRGTPSQLRGLVPGDVVRLGFRTYGDEVWLWPDAPDDDNRGFATWGVLTGPVEGLDPFGGKVRVGGQDLLAHPEVVRRLVPGERVTLRFTRVGPTLWTGSVEESPGATIRYH